MSEIELTPETASSLLARYGDFYDGLVVGFSLRDLAGLRRACAHIDLKAKTAQDEWATVTFRLTGVTSYLFQQNASGDQIVLSLGIGIHFVDEGVLLDLSPATERPWQPNDIRNSLQYVAGQAATFETTPLAA